MVSLLGVRRLSLSPVSYQAHLEMSGQLSSRSATSNTRPSLHRRALSRALETVTGGGHWSCEPHLSWLTHPRAGWPMGAHDPRSQSSPGLKADESAIRAGVRVGGSADGHVPCGLPRGHRAPAARRPASAAGRPEKIPHRNTALHAARSALDDWPADGQGRYLHQHTGRDPARRARE